MFFSSLHTAIIERERVFKGLVYASCQRIVFHYELHQTDFVPLNPYLFPPIQTINQYSERVILYDLYNVIIMEWWITLRKLYTSYFQPDIFTII